MGEQVNAAGRQQDQDSLRADLVDRAFAPVWSDGELARARSVLARTMAAAKSAGVRLYLDCGTLLGYVRERCILPWDDDIDLSIIGKKDLSRLTYQLKCSGLAVVEPELWRGTGLKVFDPSYGLQVSEAHEWTWPNLDIFFLSELDDCLVHGFLGKRLAGNPMVPGTRIRFETVDCWAPARPAEVLDAYYRDWRTMERSNHLNHRREVGIETIYERPIRTNSTGRKLR